MNLAADMMARPEAQGAHESALSELMIAVIERFTPWRSFPASIREMNVRSGDWRIRRITASMRREARRGAALDTFAQEAGLSRAHFFRLFESSIGVPPKVFLNVVRMEQAVDAVLNQIRKHLRHQRPARLCRACAFHPLLPQPCRREPARVPQCLPACELMVRCTGRGNETGW